MVKKIRFSLKKIGNLTKVHCFHKTMHPGNYLVDLRASREAVAMILHLTGNRFSIHTFCLANVNSNI